MRSIVIYYLKLLFLVSIENTEIIMPHPSHAIHFLFCLLFVHLFIWSQIEWKTGPHKSRVGKKNQHLFASRVESSMSLLIVCYSHTLINSEITQCNSQQLPWRSRHNSQWSGTLKVLYVIINIHCVGLPLNPKSIKIKWCMRVNRNWWHSPFKSKTNWFVSFTAMN